MEPGHENGLDELPFTFRIRIRNIDRSNELDRDRDELHKLRGKEDEGTCRGGVIAAGDGRVVSRFVLDRDRIAAGRAECDLDRDRETRFADRFHAFDGNSRPRQCGARYGVSITNPDQKQGGAGPLQATQKEPGTLGKMDVWSFLTSNDRALEMDNETERSLDAGANRLATEQSEN